MQTIHGPELLDILAPFRKGLRAIFRKAENPLSISEEAVSLRQIAHKYFGIDAVKLEQANDEQVVSSLGHVGHLRSESRYDAQMGIVFCLAGISAPLVISSVSYPLVYGAFGIYKLLAARQKEQKAVLQASRAQNFLSDTPRYNTSGQLQRFV